jgi:hypothetical protein
MTPSGERHGRNGGAEFVLGFPSGGVTESAGRVGRLRAAAVNRGAVESGKFTLREIEKWSLEEIVYHLDGDEHEREAIERGWAHRVRYDYGLDDVPDWYIDQQAPVAVALPRRRARDDRIGRCRLGEACRW